MDVGRIVRTFRSIPVIDPFRRAPEIVDPLLPVGEVHTTGSAITAETTSPPLTEEEARRSIVDALDRLGESYGLTR